MKTFKEMKVLMLACSSSQLGEYVQVLDFDALAIAVLGEHPDGMYGHSYYSDSSDASRLFDFVLDNCEVEYYAEPKESYVPMVGYDRAVRNGKGFLILENMS